MCTAVHLCWFCESFPVPLRLCLNNWHLLVLKMGLYWSSRLCTSFPLCQDLRGYFWAEMKLQCTLLPFNVGITQGAQCAILPKFQFWKVIWQDLAVKKWGVVSSSRNFFCLHLYECAVCRSPDSCNECFVQILSELSSVPISTTVLEVCWQVGEWKVHIAGDMNNLPFKKNSTKVQQSIQLGVSCRLPFYCQPLRRSCLEISVDINIINISM